MRSKGSRFTLGVWGLRVCSLDVASASATVRNRSQPFATVRNRSCEDRMAVPMGSFAEVVLFGGFRRLVASFRVAGVALRDIQTCSGTCRKSFCVAGAILLLRFRKMCCSFRGRCSTLDVSIVIFRGRRGTWDVSCCVFFCKSHWQGCVKWRQLRCKFLGRSGISCDVLKIDGSLARNIDFEVANFRVPRKTRRKTLILKLTKCENWRKSRTKCSFWCSHLSLLESLVFPWLRRVYGGSCKTCPFVMLPTVKIAGSLVRNAGFSASTCLVSSPWFSCGVAVSMGEAGKHLLFECVQAGCHVVLRGKRGTLWHSNRFDNASKMSKLQEVSYAMLVFLHPWLESLVFLWGRRGYVGSWKTSPIRMCPSRLSCRFAWQAWHLVTFQPVW